MQELPKGIYSGKVISTAEEDGLICCHTSYDSNSFNNKRHFHRNTHLSFVLNGGVMEKKKDDYDRLPGYVTFYHAGEPHEVLNLGDSSHHVNLEIEERFFKCYDISEQDLYLALCKMPDIKFIMLKMYQELLRKDRFSTLSLQLLFLKLVSGPYKFLNNERAPKWVGSVDEFLRANWNQKITLAQLADIAGVHAVTISKYFPRYFGCTLGEYMRKLKIDQSLHLIKSRANSLTAVAYECGFADQSHFTRTFKGFTGLLPTSYHAL